MSASPPTTSKVQFQSTPPKNGASENTDNTNNNMNGGGISEKEQQRLQLQQQLERYNQPVVSVAALLRRVGNHIEVVTKGETTSELVRRKLQLQHQSRSLSAQPASTSTHTSNKKPAEKEKDDKEKNEGESDEAENDAGDKETKKNNKRKGVGHIHDTAELNPLQGRAKNEVSVSTFLKGLGNERVKDVVQRRLGAGSNNNDNNNNTAGVSAGVSPAGNEKTLMALEAMKMNDEMIKFLEAQTAFDYEIVVNTNNNNNGDDDKNENKNNNNNDDDGDSEEKKKKKEMDDKIKERRERKQITDPKLRREIIKQAILHLRKTHPALAALASSSTILLPPPNATSGAASVSGMDHSMNNSVNPNNNTNNNITGNTIACPSPQQLQLLKREFRKAVQASIRDYVSARKSQQLDTLFHMLSKITRPDGFYKMHTPIGDGAFGQTHLVEWVPAAATTTSTTTTTTVANTEAANPPVVSSTPAGTETPNPPAGATDQGNNNNTTNNNSSGDEIKQFRLQAATNPAGAVSYLSCSRQWIPGADGTRIPRERAFVCKMESRSSATRRGNIVGTGQSEQRTLANCAHPNIVSFVDRFSDSYNYYLIMEFVDGTDLREEVKRRAARSPPKLFSISSVLFLFVQTLLGVEYLHRHNILHRDLKTANILISFKWQVKICDLGFAKEYVKDTDGDNNSITALGTPYYMSPEILNGDPYGEKVDMWSLGIILYEILSLQRPFTHADAEVIAERILTTEAVPVTEYRKDIPSELVAILKQLMNKDPKLRPSAKDILKTPIFTNAVEDYIGKMRTMAASAGSAIDRWWVEVLEDHQRLVCDDYRSAQKSRNAERADRRAAMSMTGTKFLHTTMAQ